MKDRASFPDPMELYKQCFKMFEDNWEKIAETTLATEQFASTFGKQAELYSNFVDMYKNSAKSHLQNLHIPTQDDIIRVADLIISLENKIDSLDERLDTMFNSLNQQIETVKESLEVVLASTSAGKEKGTKADTQPVTRQKKGKSEGQEDTLL